MIIAVLTILSLFCTTIDGDNCPINCEFSFNQQKCYCIGRKAKNYFDAYRECEQLSPNASLVSIHSAIENANIIGKFCLKNEINNDKKLSYGQRCRLLYRLSYRFIRH
jgi:hypothetical protein